MLRHPTQGELPVIRLILLSALFLPVAFLWLFVGHSSPISRVDGAWRLGS